MARHPGASQPTRALHSDIAAGNRMSISGLQLTHRWNRNVKALAVLPARADTHEPTARVPELLRHTRNGFAGTGKSWKLQRTGRAAIPSLHAAPRALD